MPGLRSHGSSALAWRSWPCMAIATSFYSKWLWWFCPGGKGVVPKAPALPGLGAHTDFSSVRGAAGIDLIPAHSLCKTVGAARACWLKRPVVLSSEHLFLVRFWLQGPPNY